MKSTLFFIGLFLMNLAIADDLSDSNIIFDLLERDYPELYSPSDAETYISDGYIVRYYESTDNYLGTKEGKVYEYVEESDEMEDLGSIEEFLALIQESKTKMSENAIAIPTYPSVLRATGYKRSHCQTTSGGGRVIETCRD